MAAIEFRLRTESLGCGEVTTVTPYVGGISLVELARRAESRAAKADGQPDLAGSYAGLAVGDRRWQDWYSGADPQIWFGDGDSCLLGGSAVAVDDDEEGVVDPSDGELLGADPTGEAGEVRGGGVTGGAVTGAVDAAVAAVADGDPG